MPTPRADPLAWMRANLFRTWKDTLLTVVFAILILVIAIPALGGLITADWKIVRVNIRNFMVGPDITGHELWAPAIGLMVIALSVGVMTGALRRRQLEIENPEKTPRPSLAGIFGGVREFSVRFWPLVALVLLFLVLARSTTGWALAGACVALMLFGRILGTLIPGRRAVPTAIALAALSPIVAVIIIRWGFGIEWDDWGGFLLVAFAGGAGIILSFPLGLILALGRRSKLPAIRVISVGYIEFFRGVPLLVLLIMGSLVVGLVLPQSLAPALPIRAVIIFTLFTAAYVAEIVRGGLQSLPPGQEEASKALGMPAWRTMSFIVLPQALRNVIPAQVGQAISLWKDTSLMFAVGLSELLGIAALIRKQEEFRGDPGIVMLTIFFAGLIYWVVSYTMSRESQRLETKLGVGTR